MAETSGIMAAVAAALDDAPPPVLQPSLFPAAGIADLAPGAGQADRQAQLRARGPGRPAGSANRRTVAFRDYVLARGEHPVDGLIEAYSRPVGDLALELGCTRLEAFRAQMDARRVVLEYVEGKAPVSLNVNAGGGIAVVFEGFAPGAAAPVIENEYIQELREDAP